MPRKPTAISATCDRCGIIFRPKPDSVGRFCSQTCQRKYQAERNASLRQTKACEICGAEFEVTPARKGARYCSMKCYGAARTINGHIEATCEECGRLFLRRRGEVSKPGRTGAYCSRECSNAGQARKARERKDRRRASILTEAWRDFVFIRDGYRCQECGSAGTLNAHHIKTWATFPAGRFDPANGTTLCVECHKAVHRKSRLLQKTE